MKVQHENIMAVSNEHKELSPISPKEVEYIQYTDVFEWTVTPEGKYHLTLKANAKPVDHHQGKFQWQ